MSKAQSSIFPSADEAEAVVPGQFLLPKVFAQPFRLAFNRATESKEQTVWIEVRSLDGLRRVSAMLQTGELVQIDPFSSLEMQLWGLLAEHCGFMRAQGNTSTLAAGIQPLGSGIAPLAEDLASIMGGDDEAALRALDAMQSTLQSRPCSDGPMKQPPLTHEFVKPDGVNLTEDGENALLNLVHGTGNVDVPTPNCKESADAIAFRKESDNAIAIFDTTPVGTPEEVEAETKESIDCSIRGEGGSCKRNAQPPEGEIKIGPEIAKIGRLIADVGRGLDSEADKAIQEESEAALEILEAMIEIDRNGLEALKAKATDVLTYYGTSMEEIKELADKARKVSEEHQKANRQPRPEPAEARKATDENVARLMQEISEIDLAMLIGQSQPQQDEDQESKGPDGPHTTYVAPDPEAPYKPKDEGPQGKV